MDGPHPNGSAIERILLGERWRAAQRARNAAAPGRKFAKMPPSLWRPAALAV